MMIVSLGLGKFLSIGQFGGGDVRLWEILLIMYILFSFLKSLLIGKLIIRDVIPLFIIIPYFYSTILSGMNFLDYYDWLRRMTLVVLFILLYFVVSQNNGTNKFPDYIKWITLPGVLIATWGLVEFFLFPSELQTFGMLPRARAFFEEANEFSLYLTLPFGFLLALLFFRGDTTIKIRLMYIIGLLIVIMAQILTFSRGGWFSFVVQLSILFIIINKSVKSNLRKILSYVSILITVLFIINFYNPEILSKVFALVSYRLFTSFSIDDYSTVERFMTIQNGLSVTFSSIPNFIVGIGIGNLGASIVNEATTTNYFVDILVETGIIGLISFSLLIIYILIISRSTFKLFKKISDDDLFVVFIGAFLSFIGLLTGGLTSSTHMLCFFWFIVGLLFAINKKVIDQIKERFLN